ncbi:MAG: bacillithiol biosynthesis cysteine-adding enzyme BshC [Chitinophagales bacterium]|nr:bacillithiol biosynthesis cysteine-adding enzyme BshC [Chitinophagales bacterium]MCO5281022.1 bacillithiol biosynthesis cysteine-adding enzyme BshC [Chitinophagales bacterium]
MAFTVEKISLEKINLLSPLMRDYLFSPNSVKQLFSAPFEENFIPQIIEKKQTQKLDRLHLSSALLQQAKRRKATAKALENIELLKQENTFTITCAHQPTLLLHPAYYFHKICSTIALAKQLSATFNTYNFVPVFWIGSEDHDVEELCNATLSGSNVSWQTLQTGAVGRFLLDDGFKQILSDFKIAKPDLEIHSLFSEALENTKNFGEFTAYVVQELFSNYGLVVLNQDDAKLKQHFAPIIEDEILNSRAEKVLQPTVNYLEQNYKVQAAIRPINFFYLGGNFRERIVKQSENEFAVLNTDMKFSTEEMKNEIAANPKKFSGNVFYRTLLQESILPNVAFVGGGAESSYWLEQKPLFEYFNIPFPMIVHRTPVVVLPQSISRKIEKLNLKIESVFTQQDEFVKNYLTENFGDEISLSQTVGEIESLYSSVEEKLAAIDSTLSSSVRAEKQKTLAGITQLETKAMRALKRRSETAVEQLKSVYETFFVNGALQERKVNFFELPDAKALIDEEIAQCHAFEKCVLVVSHKF